MQLERVLTKLKFDESVNGYALITNDGHPFLSFSLPDEVLPQIKGTLRIHAADLKLMNILTDKGSVVLARIDPRWVLAVLFSPELHLGGALSRTQDVVNLLIQVELPPPPEGTGPSEIEVIPEPEAMAAVSSSVEPTVLEQPPPVLVDEPPVQVEVEEIPLEEVEVYHGCIVRRGVKYREAVTLDSKLNLALKRTQSNLGVDILLIIDEKMTVFKIAEKLAKTVERVLDAVAWCVSKRIVDVECPDEQVPEQKELVELPLFEGNLDKAKKQHRAVLELCDGTRTLQQIANVLGIPYFEALQCTIPYRGKSLQFIRTVKLTGG